MRSQYRFGMELHAFQRPILVTHAHNHAVISFGGHSAARREATRARLSANGSASLEAARGDRGTRLRPYAEFATSCRASRLERAPPCPREPARSPDALSKRPESALRPKPLNHLHRNSRLGRRTWPRRNHDPLRLHRGNFVQRNLVVPNATSKSSPISPRYWTRLYVKES